MHRIMAFKGFKDVSINLLRPFTLLIGPNGSGKTNVIEAIELLSFIARGQPLYEIADIGRTETGLQIRGGLQACGHMDGNTFMLGFSARARFDGASKPIKYEIYIDTKPHPQIRYEELKVDNRAIYETLPKDPGAASRDLAVKYDNFAPGGRKPRTAASSERSVLSQYREIAQKNRNITECVRLVQIIMRHLQASFVFDPNPRLMHGYERIGNNVLSKNGANLSAVLYSLSTGDETQRTSLDRLLSQISQLPDEPYKKFSFTTTDLGDVIFGLREKTGYTVDARSLSDGTLRTLAILTALETVQQGSHVIVEEFDNG
ncbi:MAG: ATP-binding protein, partial [Gemmatimonadota bacterium]|nr:ATP-binding protein [Gemmatimonadota bacterium]